VEIGVAAVIFLFGALVVFRQRSYRRQVGRRRAASRLFSPLRGAADLFRERAILVRALRDPVLAAESFVSREELKKILTVLVPTVRGTSP